ncbi:NUDIX domain-containing protein [Streptomyces sp. I05A-00742]|uniref:NUDIX domain-containing protein n=1 Tax=Streptomyces sp. I05A-00742 TaxID=2732853 RepID=UPI001489729C|nr:NUDIX hydrolase [Streptomyces sp. I05A-00742]
MVKPRLPLAEYVAGLPKAAVYAALFFTDTEDRPLQLRSSVKQGLWQFPGGDMDPGESPFGTAVRECREETGIVFTGRPHLLAVDFALPGLWPVAKTGFVFDGGRLTPDALARIVLDPGEHDAWEVRPMTGWARIMDTRTWHRLAAVNRARRTRTTAYLESSPDPAC